MEADQPITGRTISTDHLYTSPESKNWLLDRGIATFGTLQKWRNGIPSEPKEKKKGKILVQLVILKR